MDYIMCNLKLNEVISVLTNVYMCMLISTQNICKITSYIYLYIYTMYIHVNKKTDSTSVKKKKKKNSTR